MPESNGPLISVELTVLYFFFIYQIFLPKDENIAMLITLECFEKSYLCKVWQEQSNQVKVVKSRNQSTNQGAEEAKYDPESTGSKFSILLNPNLMIPRKRN